MPDPSGLYPQPPNLAANQGILGGNPLQAAAAIQQLQQGNLQLQQLRAQQAVGSAFQSAINPDGTFNPNAALLGVKNNPNAAFAAPGAVSTGLAQQGNILENRNREIGIATNQLNLGVANNTAAAAIMAPYANKPNLTDEDVYNIKTKLAAAGIDAKTVAAADVRSPVKALKAAQIAATQTMGPAAAATPVEGQPEPGTGAPTKVPLASTLGVTSRPVGNPLGSGGSETAYNEALNREATYGQEMYPMKRALDLVQKLGPGGTGPGSEGRNNFASFINSMTPSSLQGMIPGVDPNKIKDFDEFNKYVTQAAQSRAAGIGAHTDQQLATTLTASPSAHISGMAVGDVLKANIALRNMQRVQTMAAKEAGPLGFRDKAAEVAGQLDPRAFLLPMLNPQQRADLSKNLTGAERTRFNNTVDLGIKYGAIDPESLAPAAAGK